eukprot:TRINITY_DN600_c0_g1_i2.p1 TRINITY_DN600_c0_g1~~TRINITY_DN600_c0_g1_i2.p1  ORF type:complete len:662 (+),score=153.42 TRINITY_DN600_c0_g1_i2:60-2045(+)
MPKTAQVVPEIARDTQRVQELLHGGPIDPLILPAKTEESVKELRNRFLGSYENDPARKFERFFREPLGYFIFSRYLKTAKVSKGCQEVKDSLRFHKHVEKFRFVDRPAHRVEMGKTIATKFLESIKEDTFASSETPTIKDRNNPMKSGGKRDKSQKINNDRLISFAMDVHERTELPFMKKMREMRESEGPMGEVARRMSLESFKIEKKPRSFKKEEDIEIALKEDDAPTHMFDEILADRIHTLHENVFPQFLKSKHFSMFLRMKMFCRTPAKVEDFEILQNVGRGALGLVRACKRGCTGKVFAVKCMKKSIVKMKHALTCVLAERCLLARVSSPFIVKLRASMEDTNSLYLVLDLCLGGDLRTILTRQNRKHFNLEEGRFIGAEMLMGLQHLHQNGIVYRDLKPGNIVMDHTGHVRLTDMGMAQVVESRKSKLVSYNMKQACFCKGYCGAMDAHHYLKGEAGTPGYWAPEMLRQERYSFSVDIWSFGVVFFEILSGINPFLESEEEKKLGRQKRLEIRDKKTLEGEIDFDLPQFSEDAKSLLRGLLDRDVSTRLGCGKEGIEEIKKHPFFKDIGWGALSLGLEKPPLVPQASEILDFTSRSFRSFGPTPPNMTLTEDENKMFKHFAYHSEHDMQTELVAFFKLNPKLLSRFMKSEKTCTLL